MDECWIKLLRSDDRASVEKALTDLYKASIRDSAAYESARWRRRKYLDKCFSTPESVIQRAVVDFWDEMRSARETTASNRIANCREHCTTNGEFCSGESAVALIEGRIKWVQCEEDERRKEERFSDDMGPDDREDEGSHSRMIRDTEAVPDEAECFSRVEDYLAELVSPKLAPDMYELWRLKYGEEWSYSDLYVNRYETVQRVADRLGKTIGSADVLGQFMRTVNGYMRKDARLESCAEFLRDD